jgi:hypothetical protein
VTKLEEVQRALCPNGPSAATVSVYRDTVTVTASHDPEVNFAMFRRLSDALGTDAISVRQESGTVMLSEVTADGWSLVEFEARGVAPEVVAAIEAALRAAKRGG